LYLSVGIAHGADHTADFFKIGRLRIGDLHNRAAGKFDREVQATDGQHGHGKSEGGKRNDVKHQRMPHERNVAPDSKKFHVKTPWRW
jgi:hypothetical protein